MSARDAPREHVLGVRGRRLAYRQWGDDHEFPVIALHGWLDNAASFDALGPLLHGARVIALDLAGHGLSDHRSPDASYNIWDDLPDLVWFAGALGLERYALLGHSRGAAIATLLAAIEAPAVSSLVLLDNMLAPHSDAEHTVRQLHDFAHDYGRRLPREPKVFASAEAAVDARCAATGIERSAAQMLVARSLQQVAGGYRWRTDGRLRYASALKLARDNVRAVLGGLALPGLLLLATRGIGTRLRGHEALGWHAGLEVAEIDGCHHCHMLGEAPAVAARIRDFWRRCGQG
jgi:pimeloyl-ACP methyl ester carboxylesterase